MTYSNIDNLNEDLEGTIIPYQSVIEKILHPVIILDKSKRITGISKTAMNRLQECTPSSVIGNSLYIYINDKNFPFRELCCRINNLFDYVLEINSSVTFRYIIMGSLLQVTLTSIEKKRLMIQINEHTKTGKRAS